MLMSIGSRDRSEVTLMAGRDTDIRRFGELTGNSVDFRQFSSPAATSSDWSLLHAVSRSAEPSRPMDKEIVPVDPLHDNDSAWSMLANLGAASPPQGVEAVVLQPKPVPPETAQAAPVKAVSSVVQAVEDIRPAFAHMFRKPSTTDTTSATAPLVELLKAISRCP